LRPLALFNKLLLSIKKKKISLPKKKKRKKRKEKRRIVNGSHKKASMRSIITF